MLRVWVSVCGKSIKYVCFSLAKSEPACLLPEFKFDTALETETSSNGDKV